MSKKPVMLMILDGFGKGAASAGNAVENAQTPVMDRLFSEWNSCYLYTSGLHVGLPEGQMGNSEVGHLNIGGGRVVFQDLPMINNDIANGDFFKKTSLLDVMESVKKKNTKLHLLGLCSKGGVHSHLDHLKALLHMAKELSIQDVYVHAITDGRDVSTNAAQKDLLELSEYMDLIGTGKIATISGRYYAMDRDKRWDRVQICYENMVYGTGIRSSGFEETLRSSYDADITDEFIQPSVLDMEGLVEKGDSIIFFNFRPDRGRELTRAFVDDDFIGFHREKIEEIAFATMTEYDADIRNVRVVYAPEIVPMTLSEYVNLKGKKQLKIAETEKYAHVTFFFNGGLEEPFSGEDRILIPSPKVSTYDLKPEMSAYEVTEEVISRIQSDQYDLIVLNFANADMVGHTGVYEAAVKAIETLDVCVGRIWEAVSARSGVILMTADHGNAECMVNEDGTPFTQHTTNVVPCLLLGEKKELQNGSLCDIAPTLLELMDIEKPEQMTGKSLIKRK